MTLFAPSCYPDFRCIADQCRHSCCIGWDVVIDEDTADRYRTVDGEFGRRLCNHMHRDDDGDMLFAMQPDGRCPFLNVNGLCDIITTLGEQALCQICDDHPRFYHTFSDRTEVGLGLCCEAAAALMLSQKEPMTLITLSQDAPLTPTDEEAAFFDTRHRLFAIAQDRSRSVYERETALMTAVGKDAAPLSASELYDLYHPLERLDDAWSVTLSSLSRPPIYDAPTDTVLEQLLWYGLHRHTADALTDGQLAARVALAVHAVRLLTELAMRLGNDLPTVCELARQYSAEIEYSDENPQMLLMQWL